MIHIFPCHTSPRLCLTPWPLIHSSGVRSPEITPGTQQRRKLVTMLVRLLPVNMRSDTEWPGDNVHKTQRPTNGINQTVGEDIWAQGAFVYAVFAFKRRLFSKTLLWLRPEPIMTNCDHNIVKYFVILQKYYKWRTKKYSDLIRQSAMNNTIKCSLCFSNICMPMSRLILPKCHNFPTIAAFYPLQNWFDV